MSSTGGRTQPRGRHALLAPGRFRGSDALSRDEREIMLAIALSECLDQMQNNGGDIEAALERVPGLAPEIRPLLEVAALLLPGRA